METLLKLKAEREAIDGRIRELADTMAWQDLADLGLTAEAVRRYRDVNACGLRKAYDVVGTYRDITTYRGFGE